MDIFCVHIFLYVLSSFRIDFMLSVGNWLMKLPQFLSENCYRKHNNIRTTK